MGKKEPNIWGVLGGMGPLASAEFVATIYDSCRAMTEQEMPIVYLHSNPRVPDRTSALLTQEGGLLLRTLEEGINTLLLSGATRIIVCCMTLHCMVNRLPLASRQQIISLLDVLFDSLSATPHPHLMMCTLGTRLEGLYENHVRWKQAKNIVIMPDDSDQKAIHELIYEIKRDKRRAWCDDFINYLSNKYDTRGFIAGCTELHLVARRHKIQTPPPFGGWSWIDPLEKIANLIASGS